jgi:SAM-dependent methyltransferase
MLLARVLRDLISGRPDPAPGASTAPTPARAGPSVLNVGGGSKAIPIPPHYAGWNHLLLDIDASGHPDIVGDARELDILEPDQFDAIYCSHNLEHYYRHDGQRVLAGFLRVLKPAGFAEIRVPDLMSVMQKVIGAGMDIEDTLYVSPSGPIAVRDVFYGLARQIESSGVDFYAHKTGFSEASLQAFLTAAGFACAIVHAKPEAFELRAFAFKAEPTIAQRALLGL